MMMHADSYASDGFYGMGSGGMMFMPGAGLFMWLTSLLFIAILILGAIALWKYINKK